MIGVCRCVQVCGVLAHDCSRGTSSRAANGGLSSVW